MELMLDALKVRQANTMHAMWFIYSMQNQVDKKVII